MYDILVIGSGIAGLTVALKASSMGHSVLLLTKGAKPDGSTNYAQGGIASVTSPDDSFAMHIADTLEAGDGLCKKNIVSILTKKGPETIRQLIEWGVRFTTANDGDTHFDLHLEGGHSHRRILHTADLTGKEIMRALLHRLHNNSQGIDFVEHSTVLDLITQKDSKGRKYCCGAIVANQKSKKAQTFFAKTVVLATGGAGKLWLHSTNPPDACGEGISVAYRAGAALQDLEFMQFHPTSLYAPHLKKAFLISEAVRGFGGILKNHSGKEFMNGVHPLHSLAPRDIVARAILSEMQRTGKHYMFLDVTHRKDKDIHTHFPNIYAKCLEQGINIAKDWIPVVPAAHYMCGGVLVDSHSKTTLDGLYACGEISATGVHGANRLASNSLLESVVFALRACENINKDLSDNPRINKIPQIKISKINDSRFWEKQKRETQKIMWDYCGIVRSMSGLQKGLQKLSALESECNRIMSSGKTHSIYAWNFKNFVQSAKLVVQSALLRKESRGLQCLTDYPHKSAKYKKHFTIVAAD